MPAFLVHGVPDTSISGMASASISSAPTSSRLDARLRHTNPPRVRCTKEAYASWLIAGVEEVGEPVDIVGHDWGSLLVQRLVSLRPDLVRTWTAGGAALDADYVWHDTAKTRQTPKAGEKLMRPSPRTRWPAPSPARARRGYARDVPATPTSR